MSLISPCEHCPHVVFGSGASFGLGESSSRLEVDDLKIRVCELESEVDRLRAEYHRLLLDHLRVMKRDGDLYDASGFGSSADIMRQMADEGLFEITVNGPDNRIMGRLTEAGIQIMGG